MLPKFTKQELETAVQQSTSIRQVLQKLGLIGAGGNYATIHRWCTKWNINTSHFLGQGHNKGSTRNNGYRGPSGIPLSELLVEVPKYHVTSHKLKKRLINQGLFTHKCYKCERTEWFENPIPLELEHINGNHNDNRIENLTLLCPNCHALTPTYRGKNKKCSGRDSNSQGR